jgi:RNA polymerase sigma factor (sigma-70 family)
MCCSHRSGAELRAMQNPAGYLYRVGQSAARRYRRWERHVVLPPERPPSGLTSEADVLLHEALARLEPDDRTVVVLVHSYGYRYVEVAELLGWREGSVRNRLHRAMARLRRELGEETNRAHHR